MQRGHTAESPSHTQAPTPQTWEFGGVTQQGAPILQTLGRPTAPPAAPGQVQLWVEVMLGAWAAGWSLSVHEHPRPRPVL